MRVKDDNDTMVAIGDVQSVENTRKSDAGGEARGAKKSLNCDTMHKKRKNSLHLATMLSVHTWKSALLVTWCSQVN